MTEGKSEGEKAVFIGCNKISYFCVFYSKSIHHLAGAITGPWEKPVQSRGPVIKDDIQSQISTEPKKEVNSKRSVPGKGLNWRPKMILWVTVFYLFFIFIF